MDGDRVAILIVAYNGESHLPDCLTSLRHADFSGLAVETWVLDNASPDQSGDLVRQRFPECHVVVSQSNRGFAEGNNYLLQQASSRFPDLAFVYLLNQDTIVDRDFLQRAITYSRQHPRSGAVQSLLLLHPETELVNTAGNTLHFLGFGLTTCYRERRESVTRSGVIGYPSGASVLIRHELVRQHGLFSPELFMYLEDAELGLQLHLLGRPPHLCCESIVYHKYQYSAGFRSYRYLERNRWWLLAVHYRTATLIVMLPAILVMELGQVLYALQHGLLGAKWKAAIEFFSPQFLRKMWVARCRVQSERTVGDRALLEITTGVLVSPLLTSPLVKWVANPCLKLYRSVMLRVVFW